MPSTSRARVFSTEAIALKRMDFGEADRIITLLTPAHGKIRVIARGVRRPTSRMAGHLELFSRAHLVLARGRELDVVTQAATVDAFRAIRENLEPASQAYHMADLVDLFLQDRDENRPVFQLLCAALEALAGGAAADLIVRHFEVQLLSAVGFEPRLYSCLSCQAPIQAEANAYSVLLGGVLCPGCAAREPSGRPIATDTLKLLRFLQRTASVTDALVVVPTLTVRDAERHLRETIEFVLERRLRAAEFVHQVAEAGAGYTG